jgi:RHS repeat-associated protein
LLKRAATSSHSYDANGSQTGWTQDTNGTNRTIVWNEENRIESVADNGQTKTYKYDDQGNRTIKRGPQGETVYVNQFYTQRPGANGTKHVYAGTSRIVSKLVKQDTPGANPQGNTPFEKDLYFYHPDHLGSSNYITDTNGKLYEHLEYFPFGEAWVEENSNTQRTPYLFTAKELDEETGLYYFGARYYDPRTSVWQSADPIFGKYLAIGRESEEKLPGMGGIYNPLNLGLYSYSHLNPIKFTDPDGRHASGKGFYVHQRATYLAIGQYLPDPYSANGSNAVLAKAHVFADSKQFQTGATAFRHAMRTSGQSVEQAKSLANGFVREQFDKAWSLKQAGKEKEALFEFGVALHTLQDSTSPAHHGFQEWTGKEGFGEQVGHVMQELLYPGSKSELNRITKDAWGWYQSGKLPEGDLFKNYGADNDKKPMPNLGELQAP